MNYRNELKKIALAAIPILVVGVLAIIFNLTWYKYISIPLGFIWGTVSFKISKKKGWL